MNSTAATKIAAAPAHDAEETKDVWGFSMEHPDRVVDANHLSIAQVAHPGSFDAHKVAAAGEMYDLLVLITGGLPQTGGAAFVKALADAKILIENVRALNYG